MTARLVSAKACRVTNGAEPGDRMKIKGVNGVESLKIVLRSNGGGTMYFGSIYSAT